MDLWTSEALVAGMPFILLLYAALIPLIAISYSQLKNKALIKLLQVCF